ncbi:hypothetical protein LIER_00593 [Lithospermum erythrorhizon]|uniref:Uncharacterized protein n=1 Tax=Lithospermum erythrorhizon TaxID=34254 RepID=A0AAV3NJ74_LITER
MPRIDTSVTLQKLHVDSMYKPIKQKKRTFNDENNQASRERNLPFFKNLRRTSSTKFYWNDKCSKSFEELKEYLSSPKLLSQPEQEEILQLYLVVSNRAVSSVLIREAGGNKG